MPPAEIIYEDDAVQAVHQPGAGDRSLVTFGGLTDRPATGPEGPVFWGQKPAAQLGLNTVGVLAKAENWYPAEAMRRAAPAIRARLSGVVLGYGFSMGGYAALKHGRLLGMEAALAVSPQASIDPADMAEDPRHHARFDPGRHGGMRVMPGDVAPFVAQIVDPYEPMDRMQAARIAVCCEIATLPLPFLGHSTVWHLADSAMLGRVLEHLRARDAGALGRALRQHRAASPHWARLVGRAALARGHAALAERLWQRAVACGLPPGSLQVERGMALEARAQRLAQRDRAAEALPFWLEAAQLLERSAAAQQRIATALRRHGLEDATTPLLQRLVALAPEDTSAHLALVTLLQERNQTGAALAALLAAAARLPEPLLAGQLWQLPEREEDAAFLRQALDTAPHSTARGLAALQLGRLALRRGDLAEAGPLAAAAANWLPQCDQPLLLQWRIQEAQESAPAIATPGPSPDPPPRPDRGRRLRSWLGGRRAAAGG
ncbi:tetratricopeptide repeat protein [Teichococcus vastitatis]|uniref:Tetratricopeptide repeat protein n=1 Tax=Teichococcus vastitatis TaxID=2307076 RepID=A0ABS9W8J2_9PROT|nr:hypothetical protein [Pseudoroseomonas vastitatis]MCI0755230.1 hypothetical protein [Pseudoroseomonas vastitatis]